MSGILYDPPDHADVDQLLEPRPFSTVDLQAVAEAGIPKPTLLFHGLLYRGMLHSLAGPPDSGKTTIALRAALDLLVQGETVVILDEEGGREVVAEKLLDLGATLADLDPERLIYIEFPARTWDEHDRAGLWELLGRVQPALVLADSVGAFLAVAGQNENWAEHTIPFFKLLAQAARDHNSAVVVIDHVGKTEQASRYARGSGAKLQIADVAYMVEAIRPFSRHQDGLLRVTAPKDRRGHLHRHHEIKVITDGGAMALEITAAADPADLAGFSPAATKVLEALRALHSPATNRQIVDQIAAKHGHGLQRNTVSTALRDLSEAGLVDEAEPGPRGLKYWMATVQ
jgi:hypothetical protein